MYRGHSVGVVVPAYNEAGFVGRVIETVPEYVDRVYVVDDCSTDGTWAEISGHADRERANGERDRPAVAANGGGNEASIDRRLVPIRHRENRGVGAAIRTGYLRALADGVDVAAVMAGDGQMDPDDLPAVLDPIVDGEADYAKGNRLATGDHRDGMPRFRLVGNAILTGLTKLASGYWRTRDPQNGYTAISTDALAAIDVASMYDDYGYPNDLLVRCNAARLRVANIAMPARYGDEESTIDYAGYVPRVSFLLARAFLRRLRTRYSVGDGHPVPLLYAAGTAASAGGLGGELRSLRRPSRRRTADDRTSNARLLALGCLLLALAAALDARANAPLEVRRE